VTEKNKRRLKVVYGP